MCSSWFQSTEEVQSQSELGHSYQYQIAAEGLTQYGLTHCKFARSGMQECSTFELETLMENLLSYSEAYTSEFLRRVTANRRFKALLPSPRLGSLQ